MQRGETNPSQVFQVLKLHEQLREAARDGLCLHCHLPVVVRGVDRQEDLAEGAFADFLLQLQRPISDCFFGTVLQQRVTAIIITLPFHFCGLI